MQTLFLSLRVRVCYADTLKTRQLPVVNTYDCHYVFNDNRSKISISKTSSILLTVYGFLGKRFLTGRCIVYASCVSSQAFTWPGVFSFVFVCLLVARLTASRSLCKLENADGAAGSEYSLRNIAI